METNLQIKIDKYTHIEKEYHGVIAFGGGFTTKEYLIDGNPFTSNYLFFDILFNYYRLCFGEKFVGNVQ